MRHRIAPFTGLGNPEKVKLDNEGEFPNKEFADDAIEIFFKDWEGFDYQLSKEFVAVGIEPSYQYDPIKIVKIAKNKEDSVFEYGKAFGHYGSQIVSKKKRYGDYKRQSEFTRFVDKWHGVLFP